MAYQQYHQHAGRDGFAALDGGNVAAWTPALQAKITAWLRLQDATVVSGEYSSVPDKIQTNPAVSNAARRAAQGLAASSVPIATFATNDCLSWPIGTGNNGRDQRGFAFWARQTTTGSQTLFAIQNGTLGASARQTSLFMSSAQALDFDNYVSGSNGRAGLSANNSLPAAGNWFWIRTMYDSSQSTEATKAKLYLNGALLPLTFSNISVGGTLGTLPSVTGNILIGNINDGTASSPFKGDLGPNLYVLNADLSAAEEAQLMQFEAPNP